MIGQTISHYKILEKPPTQSGQVGEVPNSPASDLQRAEGRLSIPLIYSGSGKGQL
jgi:hypothetical protein